MIFNLPFKPTITNAQLNMRKYAAGDFVVPQKFTLQNGEVKDWVGNVVGVTDDKTISVGKGGISERDKSWTFYVNMALTEETNKWLIYT